MERASSRQNLEALVRIGSNRRSSAGLKAGFHCYRYWWMAPESMVVATRAADLPVEDLPVVATEAAVERAGPGAAQR